MQGTQGQSAGTAFDATVDGGLAFPHHQAKEFAMRETEKKSKTPAELDRKLDQALKDSFPGSDPVQLTDPNRGVGRAPKEPRPVSDSD